MNFTDIVRGFENFNPCTDAFVYLKKNMKELVFSDPSNAAVYSFIYEVSLSHHRFYEDQAVSLDLSVQAKEQMLDYLNKISKPLNSNEKAEVYSVLSSVIHDYFTGERILEP